MRYAISFAVLLLVCLHAAAQGRFEVGAHFTGLNLNSIQGEYPAGIGGRFGYNVADFLTVESEVNYFPQNPSGNFGETQASWGVKAGHRFGRLGLFAKARPGLVHFGGDFYRAYNHDTPTKFAFDMGFVLESYFGSRGTLRFDLSDVIIPFGNTPVYSATVAPRYPGNSHNPQFSIGIGIRF
jgi:hypothetical protein